MNEKKVPEEYNLHRLLRVVWVYLENCKVESVPAYKHQLPEKYEKNDVVDRKPVEVEGKKREEELILLKKEDAINALEMLYEMLSEPWPRSNPCPGARPRWII
ncbi:MAG: hypothetical protein OEY25_09130 [Candidatus Aminicenantes bacterium]|nr:hypothetical protein [Candidatus Aminicenantes bacterium]MDH5467567.1 hypothetical protein [Candidatus Aminicenantes bacterium]MDH5705499.1 hypothetical protein [Candidatus Aminicenantes bacterium]